MGLFNDDDEAPPINFTPYKPIDATTQNPPINFSKIFDSVSGQEFVFKKSPTGERFLELKNLIEGKRAEYNSIHDNPFGVGRRENEERRNRLKGEIESLERESARVGQTAGDTEITINDLSGRAPIDAPFESVIPDVRDMQDVGNLPHMEQLAPYVLRYAAAVGDLTNRLRTLGDTIDVMEQQDPMTIGRYAPMINSFRQANQLAMDKGFDVKYNGLDNKLREMGLNNSTTAMGVMMSLQKQRVDTEIENNIKEYAFANNLKQESIQNLLKLGKQQTEEGGLLQKQYQIMNNDLLQYNNQQISKNLEVEKLKQNKAIAERTSELQKRQLTANMLMNRDPSKIGLNFIANNNTNAINAIGLTNTGNFQQQQNELHANKLELERFRENQLAQSNPLGEILGSVGSTFGGAYLGSLGKTLGKKHGT